MALTTVRLALALPCSDSVLIALHGEAGQHQANMPCWSASSPPFCSWLLCPQCGAAEQAVCQALHCDSAQTGAGVNQWDSPEPPKYQESTNLSARVGKLNPRWNEESNDQALYERFLRAMQLTGQEFLQAVDYCANVRHPGRLVQLQQLMRCLTPAQSCSAACSVRAAATA